MKSKTETPAAEAPAARTATIKILSNGTKARGFTFAKGATVAAVPLAHAEYLRDAGQATVIEVQ